MQLKAIHFSRLTIQKSQIRRYRRSQRADSPLKVNILLPPQKDTKFTRFRNCSSQYKNRTETATDARSNARHKNIVQETKDLHRTRNIQSMLHAQGKLLTYGPREYQTLTRPQNSEGATLSVTKHSTAADAEQDARHVRSHREGG